MGGRGTYFLLNKENDFRRGISEHIRIDESGITPADESGVGVYETRVFDSGVQGTKWHRLLLCGDFAEGEVRVTVCASERAPKTGDIMCRGKEICAESYVEFTNPSDVPLFGAVGRYLWMRIHMRGKNVRISRIKICFPQRTWLDYLPEIYQEDVCSASFLARYLGIFQALYEDMTERIEHLSERFSVSSKEPGALEELADWFSVENRELWNEEQLRYLVRHAVRLSANRGTAAHLKELLWLGTGDTAYIVEYGQMQVGFDGGAAEERMKRLYGANPCEFTILLDRGGKTGAEDFYLVEKIVEAAKPAYMQSRIVVLSPYIFLDRHSYLGINSVLGRYRQFCLDGTCAVPFSVIGTEGERQ